MSIKVKKCENVCPKCNSLNIDYDTIEISDVIYYPATCKTCGCKFKEYFTYDETEWDS